MKEVLITLFTLLCPLSLLYSYEAAKPVINNNNNGFSIDLIHRDSPLSPFYNSSLTQTELITKAALRSISRTNTLFHHHFTTELDDNNKDDETLLVPDRGDYLMKISIGTPPVETFAIADTGSDLIWVQCLPCEQCYPQNEPIFDPKKSSTFETITCGSDSCKLLPRYGCGSSGDCRYYYSYGDKSYTVGDLASDTISFGSNSSSNNGGKSLNSPKTIIGCGHDNDGKFRRTSTGLVGLGGGPLSLVSQLGDEIGHKFSYCLLPFSSNSTSKLKFGTESTNSGNGVVSTPLVPKSPSTFYYLTLEGVSIGDKKLETEQSSGNIVIDSGTTLTMLESNFYNSFESAIKEAVGNDHEPVQDPPEPLRLCYNEEGSIEKLPDMTFHFSGADIHLKKVNTFLLVDELVCLSIVPSERFSIFGNLAQINFKVGYDLQGKMVSFSPADCTVE